MNAFLEGPARFSRSLFFAILVLLPCASIGLMAAPQGSIRAGADADITIFNPATVVDRATFEEPLKYSAGIEYVLVNGVLVIKHGELVDGVFPGRAARAPIQ